MGAGNSDPFNINASDVRDLGSRARYSEAAADEDTRLLSQLQVAEEQLGSSARTSSACRPCPVSASTPPMSRASSLRKATAQEQNSLASVNSDIKGLVSQIAAAKSAAEAQRAKAAFAAMQQRAHTTSTGGGGGGGGGGGSSGTPASGPNPAYSQPNPNAPAPSPAASGAVSYAYAQLGKPYRYAGTGPDSYDCSGLTMMAWASVGVGMPHSSYAQGTMFPRVSDSDLQPGDLSIYTPTTTTSVSTSVAA